MSSRAEGRVVMSTLRLWALVPSCSENRQHVHATEKPLAWTRGHLLFWQHLRTGRKVDRLQRLNGTYHAITRVCSAREGTMERSTN